MTALSQQWCARLKTTFSVTCIKWNFLQAVSIWRLPVDFRVSSVLWCYYYVLNQSSVWALSLLNPLGGLQVVVTKWNSKPNLIGIMVQESGLKFQMSSLPLQISSECHYHWNRPSSQALSHLISSSSSWGCQAPAAFAISPSSTPSWNPPRVDADSQVMFSPVNPQWKPDR